jgi:hypothetical protein
VTAVPELQPAAEPTAPASRATAFAVRLKDAVDLDTVQDDLAAVVQRVLEPAHLTLWVSEGR